MSEIFGVPGWRDLFIEYQEDYRHVAKMVEKRLSKGVTISPCPTRVLEAFWSCSFSSLKMVILGQEPYEKRATGIAFSVDEPPLTPSLKVLSHWVDSPNMDGDLRRWARQGVLMINASLTIETSENPIPHKVLWESFIRGCLDVCSRKGHIVFLLLGNIAEEYTDSISGDNLVIKENHPAHYARKKIYGSKKDVFVRINDYLVNHNKSPIDFS